MTRSGLSFRPHGCPRCGGDAYLDRLDDPEWRCLQCGRTVPQMIYVESVEMRREFVTPTRKAA